MITCLRLIDATCDPDFHGYRWEISDRQALAGMMARLVLGEYRYVAKILSGLDAKGIPPETEAVQKRIEDLRNPSVPDHRDGWMFQMIAWIAAHHAEQRAMITPPHQQPAFKGFDSLLLCVDGESAKLCGVMIGEDKATKNARHTVAYKVWPEVKNFETGVRDDELVSSLTTLLERFFPGTVDEQLESAFWKKDGRMYRVCIGSQDFQDDEAGRRELFAGYASVAPGGRDRRRAETLFTAGQVHAWMKQLADDVASALEKLRDGDDNV